MTQTIFDIPLLRARLLRAHDLGPADFLLAHVAQDLTERLATVSRRFETVLDVMTPTSLLAQAIGAPSCHRLVLDAALAGGGNWTSGVIDDEILPPHEQPFDLAVSALGLQFVNDLPGMLVQIRRQLKPDGLFLAAMVGGQSLGELRHCLTQAESDMTGGASPRVAPFADLRDMGALLQRAGFALPVTDIDSLTVRYADMFALMRDLRAMGATNILSSRSRRFLRRDIILRAAELYAANYADADGRIRATFEIIWLSGWAPDPSQQKPLRPGSARMRLADALNVREHKS